METSDIAAANPRDIDALIGAARQRRQAGDWTGACQHYQEALRRAPTRTDLARSLAYCLLQGGQAEAAAGLGRQLLASGQGTPEDALNLGSALRQAGRLAEALAHYQALLERLPDDPRLRYNLANALRDAGREEEAIGGYLQVLHLNPRHADAWINLGALYQHQERFSLAQNAYRLAADLRPDSPDAWLNLGAARLQAGDRSGAAQAWAEGLVHCPDDPRLLIDLIHQRQQLCLWDGLDDLAARLEAGAENAPVDPFAFLALPHATPEAQLRSAQRQAAEIAARAPALPPPPPLGGPPRRLHIAYLSADFNEHATAHLLAEVLERHRRDEFLISAYDWSPEDGSPMRARLRGACERFIDIRTLNDQQAAQRLRQDGVHILVDLKGYTLHARPGIAARRPAPIQVNWLGFPGSMGADWIDYLIADPVVIPDSERRHYRERVVWMPHTYQPNDRQRPCPAPLPRAVLGLPEQALVLCAFHQPYKITPVVFELWMRLLQEQETALLWLLEGNDVMAESLRREAAKRGVDPARLHFAPRLPLAEHLARLGAADLFLDTWPVNAHTTASEALWVGTPVITCPGRTFASRVAGSLLQAAGLDALIASSPEEYLELARSLCADPARRAALRAQVQAARTSPLFDVAEFTRNLEALYRAMAQAKEAEGGPTAPR